MLEPFQLPFVQRGLVEILVLALGRGLLGTWIVLRGLAFYAHAVGTAAFPGLVLADGLGFGAAARRFAGAGARSPPASAGSRAARRRAAHDSLTALVLVGCLALGRDPRQRRLRLGRERGDAAVRQPAADRRRATSRSPPSRPWLVAGAAALSGSAGWRAASTRDAPARSASARRCPTRSCSASSRSAAVAALSAVGALLATALLVVPAATARLWRDRLRRGSSRASRGRARGRRRAVALGRDRSAARRDDRGARRRRLRRWSRSAARCRGAGRRAAPLARSRSPRSALARRLRVAGAGGGGQAGSWRRRPSSATSCAAVGGARVDVTRSCARTPTRTSTSRARATSLDTAGAKPSSCSAATASTAGWTRSSTQSGGDATVVDVGARLPDRLPGRVGGRGGLARTTRTGGTTRATWRPRSREIRDALAAADPRPARGVRAQRRAPTSPGCARSTPGSPAAWPRCRPRAQARDRPRRVRLLRPPLRDHSRRRGDPVADDAGPAVGRRRRAARAASIRRERVRAVFPESSVNARLARAIAQRDGRARRTSRCTATRSARTARPAPPTSSMERPTPTRWCAASPAGGRGARSPGL